MMETPQCRFRRRDELQNGLDAFSRTKRVRMDSVPPPQTDKTKSFLPSVVPLPSEILVPSIFGIHSRKEPLGYYANPETWRYGKTEIQISGYKLNIKDQDVFIALSQLAIERRTLTLLTTFSDLMCQLTRRLHKSYTQESKSSIEKSLERLTGGTIKIANDAGDSWFIGHLISYAGRKKGQMIVSLDPFFNRLFAPFGEFHMTPVDVKFRLSLKGEVTKQLFVFYQRQVSANPKRKEYRHAIELEKLCYLIGFDRDNKRPLSWKRFLVKTALAELRANKYLRTYSLKDDRVNVTTNAKEQWRSEKLESRERPKETEESASEDQKPAEEPIVQLPGEGLLKNLEERKGQHQRITGNRGKLRIKALKIQADAIEHRNPGLFDDFIGWLGEQNWITDISSGTLDPEQPVYQKFLAYMGLPDVDRERRDHRFKILTESKAERRERQEREGREAEAKRAQKEREDREWPEAFGWAFEQVEGGLRKDEASRSKIKDIVIRLRHRCPETWREVFQSFARAVGERYREQERRRAEGQRLPPLSILIDRSWDEITEENPT